jgi:hypothetical protein
MHSECEPRADGDPLRVLLDLSFSKLVTVNESINQLRTRELTRRRGP